MPLPSSIPLQSARTRRFSLGAPRNVTVGPDGGRVLFLRSRGGTDPLTCLWSFDVADARERLLVDPRALDSAAPGALTPEERTHRERTREDAEGIVAYAVDDAARLAVFALNGRLWAADAYAATLRPPWRIPTPGGVFAPSPDPTGRHVAYVTGGALRVTGLEDGDRPLAEPEGPDVAYGLPEHVAAESMARHHGYWWSPDGTRLLAARVDTSRVSRWHIGDPANPATPPRTIAYPAAGTANADVTLHVLGLDGGRVPVSWDREAFEYVASVRWDGHGLLVVVQSRDQRTLRVLDVDPDTGACTVVREDRDAAWTDIVQGVPARTASGALVWREAGEDTHRLTVAGTPVTPPGVQVSAVLAVEGEEVLFTASEDPLEEHVWRYSPEAGPVRVTEEPGVHTAWRAGGTTVLRSATPDGRAVFTVQTDTRSAASSPEAGEAAHAAASAERGPVREIASLAEEPVLRGRPRFLSTGAREVRTALLLPSWHQPGSARLPVLLNPYSGPALQLVTRGDHWWFHVSQWFAEHGFAVVVADGRGTPGRGPAWERAVRGDILSPVLEDQVDALHGAASSCGDLDLDRVAIRGWSFGGYLAAAAVLRRPDVFHAAVAGAPVIDQRLYDTHWKERFLGHPDEEPENYDRCSLLDEAAALARPLMLVHGLADDNVVAAHTCRLSAALLAAGRPHTVLPLSGVTHMTPQESVAENLLVLQLDFLRQSLRTKAMIVS